MNVTTCAPVDRPDRCDPLLEVDGVTVSFPYADTRCSVVRNVGFHIDRGETVAMVGESGCGKSLTALSIMGLIDAPGRIDSGSIRFDGEDLLRMMEPDRRRLRGRQIGMVFQEPMTSLNPVFTVGRQVAEVLEWHFAMAKTDAHTEAVALLAKVGIPSPLRRAQQYPHELSGGMKQRVMIAMALACRPRLLIADEPTTALDVTVQAQILRLLRQLQDEMGLAILLITHNLGIVAHFAQRAIVMYAGDVVENVNVKELFTRPLHPYSQMLLQSLPRADRKQEVTHSSGSVPPPLEFPAGCRFSTRCAVSMSNCSADIPRVIALNEYHRVACWRYE